MIENSIILKAVCDGDLEKVKKIVEKGFDIHKQNEYLLKTAAICGRYYMFKYLLDKGADLNILINSTNLKFIQDIEILAYITNHVRKQKLQRLENG